MNNFQESCLEGLKDNWEFLYEFYELFRKNIIK